MSSRTFIFVIIGCIGFFLAGYSASKSKPEKSPTTDCSLQKTVVHGELAHDFVMWEGSVNGKAMICTEY